MILLAFAGLAAAFIVWSGLDILYRHRGRLREGEWEASLEVFERDIEPRLHLPGERGAAGALLWSRGLAALLGAVALAWVLRDTAATLRDGFDAALLLLAALVLGGGLIPEWLLRRTRGGWLRPLTPLLRAGLWIALPLSMVAAAGHSLAALVAPRTAADPERDREDGIEALMEAGQEEGLIEAEDRQLVQSALEFGDTRVRAVMVPRPAIVAVPGAATLAQVRDLFTGITPVAHLPVYGATLDDILGVASMRDLWQVPAAEWPRHTVASRLRPMVFVPESASALEVLREMQRRRLPMAMVIDEYGAVAGLVTVSDLLEPLVGELPPDSAAPQRPAWSEESPGWLTVDGGVELDRAEGLLGVPLDHGDTRTLSGFLVAKLGRIPTAGEHIEHEGQDFEVLDADAGRILRLRVRARQAALPLKEGGNEEEGKPRA